MRFSFEKIISSYSDLAQEGRENLSEQEAAELEAATARALRRAARTRQSQEGAQEAIFAMQQRKQEIMAKLKERIAALGTEAELERREGERLVEQVNGKYVVRGEGKGPDVVATKGEIMTDMDWGLYYHLDAGSVDRNVRKRYLIEDAKQELQRLLDKQITTDELASDYTSDGLRGAYEGRAESTGLETGFLAERMTKGFLKKLSYDLPDADFDVLEADAFQDVNSKMDFIIQRKKHERGVEVQESERVGIQFTTNTSAEAEERKERQLDRVRQNLDRAEGIKDVVLVQIPASEVRESYNAWKQNPQPGGPEKLWSEGTQEFVFRNVLKDVLEPDEIQTNWETVQQSQAEPEEKAAAATA